MKFGMNLLLWTADLDDNMLPVLEMLKRLGYDGVEIPIFDSNVDITAQIYAPDAAIEVYSSAEIFGSLVADTLFMSSNPMVHFDEALFENLEPIPVYEVVASQTISAVTALSLRDAQIAAREESAQSQY